MASKSKNGAGKFVPYFNLVADAVDRAQVRALKSVNAELVNLYWQVGGFVNGQLEDSEWGTKTVEQLSDFLQDRHPGLKGFDRKNIYRMVQFFRLYSDPTSMNFLFYSGNRELNPVKEPAKPSSTSKMNLKALWQQLEAVSIHGSLLTEVNWSIHKILMARCKEREERLFYLEKAAKELYSVRELDRQITASLFERSQLDKLLAPTNRAPELRELGESFKDRYIFEFLNIPEPHNERDLQNALVKQMKEFILELGKDFIFVGKEYRLQVGNSDFFIDLVFYHRTLQCLVAFELKADKFKPDHLGQLEFYLEALDRDVKKPNENPSIGILLCRDRDQEVVEYAVSRSASPTIIAEYRTHLPDKRILKNRLRNFFEHSTDPDKPKSKNN